MPLRPTLYSYFKESFSGEYHMYLFIPLHSCDYLKKTLIKIIMATDKSNSQNEIWHWINDKIEVAVQSWLWVWVELKVWWLSQLKHLNGVQWSWVQIPLRSTFCRHFRKSSSGEYRTICSFHYTHVVNSRKLQLK